VKKFDMITGFARLTGFVLAASLLAACSMPSTITSERRALLIGINDYIYLPADNQLHSAENDATELNKILKETGWLEPEMLNNGTIGKADIKNKIQDFGNHIDNGETALIYFSGHGNIDDTEAYMVASDSTVADVNSQISVTEFSSWIQDYIYVKTENIILIIDACFSGSFIKESDSVDLIEPEYDIYTSNTVSTPALAGMSEYASLLAKNFNMGGRLNPIIISAAGASEESYEDSSLTISEDSQSGQGVFTYYLIESAKKGDTNKDGYISCTEAYTYASKSVDKNWNEYNGNSRAYYPHISGGLRDMVLFDLH